MRLNAKQREFLLQKIRQSNLAGERNFVAPIFAGFYEILLRLDELGEDSS